MYRQHEQEGPNTGSTAPGLEECKSRSESTTRPPKKWVRILAAFLRGEEMHRFSAETRHSDHCLPSTVSELQRKGVVIRRRDISVPGYRGQLAHVALYWLDLAPENVAKARALLAVDGGEDHPGVERREQGARDEIALAY